MRNKMIKGIDPKSGQTLQEIVSSLTKDQIRIIEDVIKNYLIRTLRPTKAMVKKRIFIEFKKEGIPQVHESKIYKILNIFYERHVCSDWAKKSIAKKS